MKLSVIDYCAAIGKDPLLVQGAGGNVSWKEHDTLWVKASGTWLSDASNKDIFIPVDLGHLRLAMLSGDFTISPQLRGETSLRPSIETLLHALMPHPVVIHLHAIEILAHLVRYGFEREISSLLDSTIRWKAVSYFKPGAELAEAVCNTLLNNPDVNVVFLQNHGVVIGGSNIHDVNGILRTLIRAFRTNPRTPMHISLSEIDIIHSDGISYLPAQDSLVHQLAKDMTLFNRLMSDWALYPDHLVFLGENAQIYDSIDNFKWVIKSAGDPPELAFVRGVGVFVRPEFTVAKYAQLRCYYDVLSRQDERVMLNSLNNVQIADLLNWDAEKYRMLLDK